MVLAGPLIQASPFCLEKDPVGIKVLDLHHYLRSLFRFMKFATFLDYLDIEVKLGKYLKRA